MTVVACPGSAARALVRRLLLLLLVAVAAFAGNAVVGHVDSAFAVCNYGGPGYGVSGVGDGQTASASWNATASGTCVVTGVNWEFDGPASDGSSCCDSRSGFSGGGSGGTGYPYVGHWNACYQIVVDVHTSDGSTWHDQSGWTYCVGPPPYSYPYPYPYPYPTPQPPSVPSPVYDAAGGDRDWTADPTTLQGNWGASTDPEGDGAGYTYCYSSAPSWAGCFWSNSVGWGTTSVSNGGFGLADNGLYYTCVEAYDAGSRYSSEGCSNGVRVDTSAPTYPTMSDPVYGNSAPISGSWSASSDGPGYGSVNYDYCFTSISGNDCGAGNVTGTLNTAGTSANSGGAVLSPGTTYYLCAKPRDGLSNAQPSFACSDGQLYDPLPPNTPAVRNDGAGADIAWTNTTPLAGNWSGVTDNAGSGLASYDWCISTDNSNSCAASGRLAFGNVSPATTSVTSGGATPVSGNTYYLCVRGNDNAGNAAPFACSNGQVYDTQNPNPPATLNDGPGADVSHWRLTPLQANWSGATDPGNSGIQNYDWCITTNSANSCGAGAIASGAATTATSATSGGATLYNATKYYLCVQSRDNVNYVSGYACSNGQYYDITAPSVMSPVKDGVGADQSHQASTTALSANWTAASDNFPVGSGLNHYDTCFSTGNACTGTIVRGWTGNGVATSVTAPGLALGDGTTYYACVRYTDNVGNVSTPQCSNGITVDTTAPPNPLTVGDGVSGDADYTSDAANLRANWTSVSDPAPGSGINRYEYCFATTANCSGGIVQTWTSAGVATAATVSGAFVEGTTYYACVRTVDNVGNASAGATCSDGQTLDFTPPPAPASASDGTGADIDYTNNATALSGSWTAATDAGGVSHYDFCWGTAMGTCDVVGWTTNGLATSVTSTGLSLNHGQTYYMCVRTWDNAGLLSPAYTCSNGQTVDVVAPAAPPTIDDANLFPVPFTNRNDQLSASWGAASDDLSGVARYDYCISTDGVTCDTRGWTPNGMSTSVTATGLTLTDGQLYHVCVRTVDVAGTPSAMVCSVGQTVDVSSPPLPPTVIDGAGSDTTWLLNTTTVDATWSPVADTLSGFDHYDYCISTSSVGANCAAGATVAWTTNGASTNLHRAGLTLTEGTTYYVCVRTVDKVGNTTGVRCANGLTVDVTPPTLPTTTNDGAGADIDYQTAMTQLRANWSGANDTVSGIRNYEFCIGTTTSFCDVVPWSDNATATAFTVAGLTLTYGQPYFVCVRDYDNAGYMSVGIACTDGVTPDNLTPATTAVRDGSSTTSDSRGTTNPTTLAANWNVVNDGYSGLNHYDYCIGTTTTNCSERAWTGNGTTTSVTASGLTLTIGTRYYSCVRAIDNLGTVSPVTCSDGQVYDPTPPVAPAGASVLDGPGAVDSAWITTNPYSWSWGPGSDTFTAIGYEYCVSMTAGSCSGSWVDNGTSTNVTVNLGALNDGDTYYICIRVYDEAGNYSSVVCSNGARVDLTPPPAPGAVRDGSGSTDAQWQNTTASIKANWSSVVDAGSGLARYEFCVSRVTACGGTPVVAWKSNAVATTVTEPVPLVEGTKYFTCVRAVDQSGNRSTATCSDGIVSDVTAPPRPSQVIDGLDDARDSQFQNQGNRLYARWTGVVDALSGVGRYEVCMSTATSCGGSPIMNWASSGMALQVVRPGLNLQSGTSVYTCVRVLDVAGNMSQVACSSGMTVDMQRPTVVPLNTAVRTINHTVDHVDAITSDAVSGIASASASFLGTTLPVTNGQVDLSHAPEGTGTLYMSATDRAGNMATWSSPLTVDRTGPYLVLKTTNKTCRAVAGKKKPVCRRLSKPRLLALVTARAKVQLRVGDALSGPATPKLRTKSLRFGKNRLRVTLVDVAGNTSVQTVVITRLRSVKGIDRKAFAVL